MNNLHDNHHLQQALLSPSPSSSSSAADAAAAVASSHDTSNRYSFNTIASSDNLSSFFQQVDGISLSMDSLQATLRRLQDSIAHYRSSSIPSVALIMDVNIATAVSQVTSLRHSLQTLDRDNADSRKLPGCQEGSSVDRIRVFVTGRLRAKLKAFMAEFDGIKQGLEEDRRDAIERRYFALTGERPTEKIIDLIVDSGDDNGEKMLRQAIEQQGIKTEKSLAQVVQEIREQHDAVQKLEASLLDLHQMFLDMSVLVEMQGEELNDIEKNMIESLSFVRTGVEELGGTVEVRRSSQKWIISGAVSVVLIAIIVTIIVLVLVLQNQ